MIDPTEVINVFISKILVLLEIKSDNLPSPERRSILISGIVKYYGNHTVEELYLACEMNYFGQYPQKIEHYQNFTIDYLSNCLHLFNEEKKAAVLKQKRKEEKISEPDTSTNESHFQYIKSSFEENNTFPTANYSRAFDHLLDTKQVDIEELKTFYENEKIKIIAEIKAKNAYATSLVERRAFELLMEEPQIKLECRKRYIKKFLDSRKNALDDQG